MVNDHDRHMWVGMAIGVLIGIIVWALFVLAWLMMEGHVLSETL